jgi:prepilin-type N-terminal cleavage/methylation domain-containing protein
VFNNKGFTLFEIIMAVFILAIAIVPIVRAYAPAIFSTGSEEKTAVFTNQARGTLSRVAALDFTTINNNLGDPVDLPTLFGSAAEAARETFLFKGENYTPTVGVTDASGGTGGLLEIGVTVGEVSLKTLKANY